MFMDSSTPPIHIIFIDIYVYKNIFCNELI